MEAREKTELKTHPPSYGTTGPSRHQEGCCGCLHDINTLEEPCLTDRNPDILSCPNCLSPVYTKKHFIVDKSTHVAAALLLPLCLCCLPYYLQCCKSVKHHCPVCNAYIGCSR